MRCVSDIPTEKCAGSRGLRSDGVGLRKTESEKYKLGLSHGQHLRQTLVQLPPARRLCSPGVPCCQTVLSAPPSPPCPGAEQRDASHTEPRAWESSYTPTGVCGNNETTTRGSLLGDLWTPSALPVRGVRRGPEEEGRCVD